MESKHEANISNTSTSPGEKKKICLHVDSVKLVGFGMVKFISNQPHVPKSVLDFNDKDVYAIYKVSDGKFYVVVSVGENQIDFYRAYRAKIPNIAPLQKLSYEDLRCKICKRFVEWDADEPYCPVHGQECGFERVEVVAYTLKQFNISEVEQGEPETDPHKLPITENNIKYALEKMTGKKCETKGLYVSFIRVDTRVQLKNAFYSDFQFSY